MPRINLLPVKAAQRQVTARNEMLAMAIIVAASFAGVVYWYQDVESEIDNLQGRLQNLTHDIGRLTTEAKKVEEMQEKEKLVKQKLDVIQALVASKIGPAKMLDDIATILTHESKRVWLTRLEQEGQALTLTGGAMDHEDVSELQLALQRRATFRDVKLKRVTTARTGKGEAPHLIWELSCQALFQSG